MKKSLLFCVMFCSALCIAQNKEKDSLLRGIKKNSRTKNAVHNLNYLANITYSLKPDSSLFYANKALKISKELNYKEGEISSMASIVLANYRLGKEETAISKIHGLLKTKGIGDKAKKTNFVVLNQIYKAQDQLDSSLKYSRAILQISKKIDAPDRQLIYHTSLGIDYFEKGYVDLSLKQMLAAIRIANTLGYNNLPACQLNINIAMIYSSVGKIDEVFYYSDIAYKMANKIGNPIWINLASLTTTSALLKLKRFDEAKERLDNFKKVMDEGPKTMRIFYRDYYNHLASYYKETGQYDLAIANYEKGIEVTKSQNNFQGTMEFHCALAYLYLDQNQADKAQQQINKASEIQLQVKDLLSQKDIYELKAKVDSIKGNAESYMKNLWEFLKLRDSLSSEKTLNKIAQLNIEYETELKDNEIQLLNTEKKVKEGDEAKMWLFQIGLSILALLLLVLAFVFYKGYSNKKKSLAIIQNKNRENKLLVQETHHRVKNNLQIISSLLNTQTTNFPDDKRVMKVVKESQNRIKSLAIIHEELYQNNTITSVSSRYYFNKLIDNLSASYFFPSKEIVIKRSVQEIELKMSIAVPLGLILNELMTNSYKYAFENRTEGQIDITFTEEKGIFTLIVSDDGIGLASVQETKYSFGLQLVEGLTEQFNGHFSKSGTQLGSQFIVTLKDVYQSMAS